MINDAVLRFIGFAIGGALGAVGVVGAGGGAGVVVDVAFVVGVVVGVVVALRTAWPARVASAGVVAFLAPLLWQRPAIVGGVVVAAVVAVAVARVVGDRVRVDVGHVGGSAALAAVAAVVYSAYGVERHSRFGSGSWDHGCYLHNAWLFAHGDAFSLSAKSAVLGDVNFWGGTNHFMPSLVFTAPIAWAMEATSSTSLLLIAQAVVVCAAAVPLAALARHRGLAVLPTWGVVFAYLFAMGTQAALLFDVHEIAPVPLLLFCAALLVETRRCTPRSVGLVAVVLLVLAGTKESSWAYAAAFGLWLALLAPVPGDGARAWRVVGVVVVVVGVVGFAAVVFVVQPALLEDGARMIHLDRFAGGGGGALARVVLSPGQTLVQLISPVQKLTTLGTTGAGFGFLSFGSGEALALALPNLAERFLADKREMWGLGFHYGLVGAAYAAFGALSVLAGWQRRAASVRRFAVFGSVFLVLSTVAAAATASTPADLATWQKPYYADDATAARYARAVDVVRGAGVDAAVVAQNHFLPHLALRRHIWLPEERFIARADVVILDPRASAWPKDGRFIARLVARLERDPAFAVAFREGSTVVFRRTR